MSKEILEITPSGGIYCLVNFHSPGRNFATPSTTINCARPNGYVLQDLLNQIRFTDNTSDGFVTDGDILRWAIAHLCETPMGRSMAHDARFDGWMVLIEDGDEMSAGVHTDYAGKCIYLPRYAQSVAAFARSQQGQMQFLFNLLKGLRLIWQENMYAKDPDDLTPEEYLLFERLVEADGDLCAILAAYQLRETGDHDLWRYLLSSDLNGIAVMMCECLDYDASIDGVIEALGFVLQDWFTDDARLNRIDHVSLTKLDERQDTDFGHGNLEFDDVLQISMLPEGYSYLDYFASEILSDGFYTRIPDETNAAHLRQITCESQIHRIEEIGFRDPDLARKFFPHSTFETVV